MLQKRVSLDYELNFDATHADDTALIVAIFATLQLATDQLQEACIYNTIKTTIIQRTDTTYCNI